MSIIHSIGGGKGGIGKSFITTNLGCTLASQGKRVALVDLNLGCPNLHTLLGLSAPRIGLKNLLDKTITNLEEAAIPTEIKNLFLLSSMGIQNLHPARKDKIIRAIQKLPFDHIILDLGSGTGLNTLDFFLASQESLFICLPEPTSMEITFTFLRAVYLRRMKQLLKQKPFRSLAPHLNGNAIDQFTSPDRLLKTIMTHEPQKGPLLHKKLNQHKFKFIINQFRKQADARLGNKIEIVCNRHFPSTFKFLGNISFDERIHDAIVNRKLFMKRFPHTIAASEFRDVVGNLAGKYDTDPKNQATEPLKLFEESNHYELLGIPETASLFKIRGAYRETMAIYDENSLATYSLFTAEEKKTVQKKIESAFRVLDDTKNRTAYDQALLPGKDDQPPLPGARQKKKTAPIFNKAGRISINELNRIISGKQKNPAVMELSHEIVSKDLVSGDDLKKIRNLMKIKLEDVFEAARISVSVLTAIEENRYDDLPSKVYLKNFIKSYATILQIHPQKIATGYLKMMANYQNHKT
jgi:flagellar biosynthesis protein FlhG